MSATATIAAPVTADQVQEFTTRLVNELFVPYWAKHFPSLDVPTIRFDYDQGKKYVRLVRYSGGRSEGIYGFVEKSTGNLLKADGWSAPAKHPRGNILAANPLEGCGPHGVAYLRG